MSSKTIFPSLKGWEPTRDTLRWYIKGVGVIPRAHAVSQPKWWHISLKVQPDGLVTEPMRLPDDHTFYLFTNLREHRVALTTSRGEKRDFSMLEGLTSKEFAQELLAAMEDLGIRGDYAHKKYDNSDPRRYDPEMAERYLMALLNVDRIFKQHRNNLGGESGPVQLWPHGFDLAFEWFGTRTVEYEEGGEVTMYPSQLNLGFSPGDSSHPEPYFYSNPFPFEAEKLVDKPLPEGASWHTEGWQGTILPYGALVEDERAADRLLEYARTVYEICEPILME